MAGQSQLHTTFPRLSFSPGSGSTRLALYSHIYIYFISMCRGCKTRFAFLNRNCYYQYYALARNVAWMQKLGWVMRISLLKTLACKHKSTVGKMARKYRSQRVSEDGRILKCFKVIIRRDAKDKPPLVANFGGFSLKWRKDAVIVDERKSNKVPYTRTELIQRLLADECELCGSREAVQVHHVAALKDLQTPGQREKPYWAQIMAARKRKTLVLCHRRHVDLHAGRLDGRPRVMK